MAVQAALMGLAAPQAATAEAGWRGFGLEGFRASCCAGGGGGGGRISCNGTSLVPELVCWFILPTPCLRQARPSEKDKV